MNDLASPPRGTARQNTVGVPTVIAGSAAMLEVLALARRSAAGDAKVLVTGESGVGKDVIARHIHANSKRVRGPFVAVNCAGLTETLLESELFGHVKGSFTGAYRDKRGKLQMAHGGTLFLDEVGEMSLRMQALLLRFLETGEIQSVGAHEESSHVDVRVISASNLPLADLVATGHFRSELLELLAGTMIVLPPLRERAGDIPALTRHFLARIGEQPGLRPLGITDSALQLLSAYDWPGNVRQLQAVLFRAAVFCDGNALTDEDFPQLCEMLGEMEAGGLAPDGVGVQLYTADGNLRPLEEIEADVIRLAIGHYRGRMTEVARRLGIGRSTLYRKLSDLGIESAA